MPASSVPARTRVFVPGKQSNHGGFFLPQEVAWLGESPKLWLAVAHWCMQAGRGVNRDEVAEAFHVTQRQAADVMTYIMHSCPQVDWVKRVVRDGAGRRVCLLRVHEVRDSRVPVRATSVKKRPASTPSQVSADELRSLKSRFLGQR
ncbi:CaiF/GrlA family transcriptional regulator [Enterobacter hormaechei]|uniref:CaiF/GrlA family transcriptional regulator n=1 Tax=Enterobacter hormaechei TaxID=158836 RepID=UPI0032DAFCBC